MLKFSIFAILFALSSSTFAARYIDAGELSQTKALYEQSALLESDAYKNESDDEKRQTVLERGYGFRKLSMEAWKFGVSALTNGAALAAGLFGYRALRYAHQRFAAHNPAAVAPVGAPGVGANVLNGIASGAGWAFTMPLMNALTSGFSWLATQAAKPFNELFALGKTFARLTWPDVVPPQDEFEPLERRYARQKPQVPSELWNTMEEVLTSARSEANPISVEDKKDKYHEQLARFVLSFPRSNKAMACDDSTMGAVFERMARYPEKTKQKLKSFMVGFCMDSVTRNIRKTAAYFYGKPGTGKTWANEELLSKMLGLPFVEISLANSKIDQIFGTEKTPGKILSALSSAKAQDARNVILFMDESDIALQTDMDLIERFLIFLDPGRKTFYFPYLNAEIDISHIRVVFAGNIELTEGVTDPLRLAKIRALLDRIGSANTIHFTKFSSEDRKAIVWQEAVPKALAIYGLSETQLDEADRALIESLIANDSSDGMRLIMGQVDGLAKCKAWNLKHPNAVLNCGDSLGL